MTTTSFSFEVQAEEEIVAHLAQLGIRYLSRLSVAPPVRAYPPAILIAELTRQPSSRVRNALIPLFLAHPDYSRHVPEALRHVNHNESRTLKFFYTAALLLQRKYADYFQKDERSVLPDYFSEELGISQAEADIMLRELGRKQQKVLKQYINWKGSYENAAAHLMRQWELEKRWNVSPQKR